MIFNTEDFLQNVEIVHLPLAGSLLPFVIMLSVPGLVLGRSKRDDWLDNKELTWEGGDMAMYSWMCELSPVSFLLFLTFS